MTDHKERAKEVWHWNRAVKGDDHPDTQRALREMQEAHNVVIKVDADEAIKLAEAARTMLAALKDVHNCPDISDYQNEMIGNAIAQAEAAGIKVEG